MAVWQRFERIALPEASCPPGPEPSQSRGMALSKSAAHLPSAPGYPSRRRRILLSDAIMIGLTLLVTYLAHFGTHTTFIDWAVVGAPYVAILIPMGLLWFGFLAVSASRQQLIMGGSIEEYQRVAGATIRAFGLIAIFSYLLQLHLSRMYFLIALPTGIVLVILGRMFCAAVLNGRRRHGVAMDDAILLGSAQGVARAVAELRTHRQSGVRVGAVALLDVPDERARAKLSGIPRISPATVADCARTGRYSAVIATSGVSQEHLRSLAWSLEDDDIQFFVVPDLVDVRGPRIQTATLRGLTMLRVELAQMSGTVHGLRRALDILFAGTGLLLLAPLLIAIAIAIRLDSPGPVLFTQERIGRDGKPFKIHKFRTMVTGAERMVDQLVAQSGGRAQLFKIRDDPRVTRLGRLLRRTSLDELPQFWDVLRGPMSVVGPRPQVAQEVAEYEDHMHRRLLMKPGITGLWQVSGRNRLSLEDSIRLDLYYVENWSPAGDLAIVLRTAKVMFQGDGAY